MYFSQFTPLVSIKSERDSLKYYSFALIGSVEITHLQLALEWITIYEHFSNDYNVPLLPFITCFDYGVTY